MTDRKPRKRRTAAAAPAHQADESERSLGRAVAIGLPLAGLGGALVAGTVASLGSALLVLAAGALLGCIALLWASIRTLSGDAPLAAELEGLSARGGSVDDRAEEKRRVLRALKDLEAEHAIGKIDDADYEAVAGRYRADAKRLMREMDEDLAPRRAEAEKLAREYLEKKGARAVEPEEEAPAPEARPPAKVDASLPAEARPACVKCGTTNDADAAFCKKCGSPVGVSAEKDDAEGGEDAAS
jgi:hypothetical protein